MSINCLVTGAGGMLGREVVRTLRELGLDCHPIEGRNQLDLLNPSELERLPEVGAVIHTAALTGVDLAWQDPERVLHENFVATLNLLGWCRKHGVKRFVFASSYVYGHPQYLPVDEAHVIQPANAYAASKYLGEQLCQEYARWGISSVALRFFNLIGPGQERAFLIPTIVQQLQKGGELHLKAGTPKRDFVDVQDAARACVLALSSPVDDSFQALNIGAGMAHSVSEIVDLLMKVSGRKVHVTYAESNREGEVQHVVADVTLAKQVLGWEARISLEDSLRRVWANS
jgi:UDP-glucose 4-epimerase